jgi:D-alanine-D-alanine ligase
MKRLRILLLVHEDLIPPDTLVGYSDEEIIDWKTEYDVVTTLTELGHDVQVLGVRADLGVIRQALLDFKPHIAFNLLEEFHDNPLYDHHVAGYLELMQQSYTGCNPRGLLIAHDKALSKKILSYHRIRAPRFGVFLRGRKPRLSKKLRFPLIVKSLFEEGSYGISQASIVHTPEKCLERIAYLHDKLRTPAIVEEFVEGRELYLSIIGNQRVEVLPPIELVFGNLPEGAHPIATSRVKWDWKYQEAREIELKIPTDLDATTIRELKRLGRRIYRVLDLTGYARIDLRVTEGGEIFVLEANANPDIGYGEEMSVAAEAVGIQYPQLLQKIVNLGLRYNSPA